MPVENPSGVGLRGPPAFAAVAAAVSALGAFEDASDAVVVDSDGVDCDGADSLSLLVSASL